MASRHRVPIVVASLLLSFGLAFGIGKATAEGSDPSTDNTLQKVDLAGKSAAVPTIKVVGKLPDLRKAPDTGTSAGGTADNAYFGRRYFRRRHCRSDPDRSRPDRSDPDRPHPARPHPDRPELPPRHPANLGGKAWSWPQAAIECSIAPTDLDSPTLLSPLRRRENRRLIRGG